MRLREEAEVPPLAEYMTLSHCWGGLQILSLTTQAYGMMREGIPLEDLPQTFQDTIGFARSLDVRFLWIDSLCIIQDSRGDWLQQASVMGEIYRGAICNIGATAAEDGRAGLFWQRNSTYLEPLRVLIPSLGQVKLEEIEPDDVDSDFRDAIHPNNNVTWRGMPEGYYDCIDPELWYRDISMSPLGRRAWVVQERLLAPRVLHFTARQLFWECRDLKACETYPEGLPEGVTLLSSASLKNNDLSNSQLQTTMSEKVSESPGSCHMFLRVWMEIVRVYSAASLTFESDKLVAIAGVPNIMAARMEVRYLAGLWETDLPRQLLWKVRRPLSRPSGFRAPSWSWASVDGEVAGVVGVNDTLERTLIEVLDVQMNNLENDITTHIKSGELRVQGRLIPCLLLFRGTERVEERYNPLVRGLDCAAFVQYDAESNENMKSAVLPGSFFCVPIAVFRDATEPTTPEVAGLVLQAMNSKGVFRRFAAFRTDNALDRDGERHPDWIWNPQAKRLGPRQFGRVFLMDVDDEQAEVEEEFYHSYAVTQQTKKFGNSLFTII